MIKPVSKDNEKLYEFSDYWKTTKLDVYMKEKIDIISKIIPKDVKNILDAGCGNGITTNVLSQKYYVTGVDRSKYALSQVKCQRKINCAIEELDYHRNSFDLILCSEVLEHLSDNDFPKVAGKIKELSRKYILVTTPNAETLRKRFSKCHQCGHQFNVYYHFRSFNKRKLKKTFNEYNLTFLTTCGRQYEYYNNFLAYIKQAFGKNWFVTNEKFLCPVCENGKDMESRPNFISSLCDYLNKVYQILFGKISAPYWQIALFKRNEE